LRQSQDTSFVDQKLISSLEELNFGEVLNN
jgi:hypothetical protein